MTKLYMDLGENGYDILIGKGVLNDIEKYFNLDRKVLIVTDDNIPTTLIEKIESKCKICKTVVMQNGEQSKSFEGLQKVLSNMSQMSMDRGDCVVAVGGGVIGDLAGFASSCYMRGIDFYNVPTTVLSQVDSSVGGKTAINFKGIKNVIGAFHQPKGVLIDVDTLKTLSSRQISNGLVEAIKMSLTSDEKLFERFENLTYSEILDNIEEIIVASVKIKKGVVEQDEKENGLRKVLNFGHTLGHGIEAQMEMNGMFHGECVALGMIPVCSIEVRQRLVKVLEKIGITTTCPCDIDKALAFVEHDKKCASGKVSVIKVEKVGKFLMEKITLEQFSQLVKKVF